MHSTFDAPCELVLPTCCPRCGRPSCWLWTPRLLWEVCPSDGLLEVVCLLKSTGKIEARPALALRPGGR